MYQQYLKDPETVDKAWWDFFADYKPTDAAPNGAPVAETPARPAPADVKPQPERKPTTPKPAAAPAPAPAPVAAPPAAAAEPTPTATGDQTVETQQLRGAA